MNMLSWEEVRRILELSSFCVGDAGPGATFALDTIETLHFLDHHAMKLAVRSGKTISLLAAGKPYAWQKARVEVSILSADEIQEGTHITPYAPGAIVRWLDATTEAQRLNILWRDYLTSVDHEFRAGVGTTLDASWPHLRLGFVTGVDLFHCGEFYAAHEDWESLWMRLAPGAEKSVVQGLIQLCGAFIHRLKGRAKPAEIMLEKAWSNIERGAETIDWIDIPKLLSAAAHTLKQPLSALTSWPEIPLVNRHSEVPRKHR